MREPLRGRRLHSLRGGVPMSDADVSLTGQEVEHRVLTPRETAELVPTAMGSSEHRLEPNAIGLVQSTVISIASSAPTAALAISLAPIVVISARGAAFSVILTLVAMLVIAVSFARLNRWDANCGASYVWVGRIFGPHFGFLVGWVVLAAVGFGTIATVLPVGPSFLSLIGANASSQLGAVLAAGVLCAVVTVLAVLGITLTARFQLGMALVEYAIVTVFAGIGLVDTFITHPSGFAHPSFGWLSPSGVGGQGSLVGALLIAVFLIAGWDASLYVNEETKQPEKNPGRAVIISVVFLGVFYALLITAFQAVASPSVLNANAASGLSFIGQRLAGGAGDKLMSLAVLLSAVATTQIGFVALARITYAMGSDRLLPAQFGRLHSRYRTPAFGTILVAAITIVVTAWSLFASSVASAFSTIVATTGVLYATFYAVSALANTWHYRSLLRSNVKDAVIVGVLPIAAVAFLTWVSVKSVVGFSPGAQWTLAAIAATGGIAMILAKYGHRSAFFRPSAGREPAPTRSRS
jgi:amino acid transporter